MTLHWWMHWFWVTMLVILVYGASVNKGAPQSEELHRISTVLEPEVQIHSERQGRAMYFTKPQGTSTTAKTIPTDLTNSSNSDNQTLDVRKAEEVTLQDKQTRTPPKNVSDLTNATQIVHPSVQWTPMNSTTNHTLNREVIPNNHSEIVVLTTETTSHPDQSNKEISTILTTKMINSTRQPDIVKEIDTNLEGAAESRIVTEKPLSLETTYLQTRVPANIESSRRVIDQSSEEGGMDTGVIAGISFAALVLAALAGSTAFVLYRRRYLNKPQTLNDKCSNPDSSGYLDDSTVRDNSEEMYSLDNDSFLNSLEAMTIQNYWTDTVKHTKL